jgi:hypothetical protein
MKTTCHKHFTNNYHRVISQYPKTAYVGSSSRKLPLSGELNLPSSPGGYGKPKPRQVRV